MSEVHLVLSSSERDLLVSMLSEAQRAKRVEIHRTEYSREFRRQVEAEEARIGDLLSKLSLCAETV